MKKYICILLIFCMFFSMNACHSENDVNINTVDDDFSTQNIEDIDGFNDELSIIENDEDKAGFEERISTEGSVKANTSLSYSVSNKDNKHAPECIPKILTQAKIPDDNIGPYPKIEFKNDGSFSFTANFLSAVGDMLGTYEAIIYSKSQKIIRCKYTDYSESPAAKEEFFFTQNSNGTWTYYGDTIGITYFGLNFISNDEYIMPNKITQREFRNPSIGIYNMTVGNWLDYDTMTIEKVDNGSLCFSVFWVRAWSLDDVVAARYGDYAFFECESAVGYMIIESSKIINMYFTTFDNPVELKCNYCKFEYFGTDQEYRDARTREDLIYDEDVEWIRQGGGTQSVNFFEDGKFKYYLILSGGDGEIVDTYVSKFYVDDGVLYIGEDAYDVDVIGPYAGCRSLSLKALGEYERDFSGYYLPSKI